MHTLAHNTKATQKTQRTGSTRPTQARLGKIREFDSIMHLQRIAGNQAVLRLLARKPQETARAYNAIAFTNGEHLDFRQEQYLPPRNIDRQLLTHELTHTVQQTTIGHAMLQRQPEPTNDKSIGKNVTKENVANIAGLHIIDYREQVKSGINNWSPPEEKESAVWFVIALAGNLTWAATSFVNPVAAGTIRAMSVVGSVIGSGTLEKALKGEAKTPDIKPKLVLQVSAYVDKLKGELGGLVDAIYARFQLNDKKNPDAGWMDANQKITERREIAWKMIFDNKVAPWGNSTAIITNTTKDVGKIWDRFDILFNAIVLSIYGYPRYKGEKLKQKVEELFYQAIVQSGVAERSVAIKKSKEWIDLKEYKVYEFPPPATGMIGAKVRIPTGKVAIPVEIE